MKQFLFILNAFIVFILSSCSNDEIPVSTDILFKINPETVLKPFTFEFNAGELESIPDNCNLRVRLLIYDQEGMLVDCKTNYVGSYVSKVEVSSLLDPGEYTALAITDVVKKDGFEWWKLSNTDFLSTTKITSMNYMGQRNHILGIGIKQISIYAGYSDDICIEPKAAGALLCLTWFNLQKYLSVDKITLTNNRNADYLIMNSLGGYDVSVDNHGNDFDWRTWFIEPFKENIDLGYLYCFVLPMNNITYRYRIDYTEESGHSPSYSHFLPLNIKAGEEYLFYCNLYDSENDNNWVVSADKINEGYSTKSENNLFNLKSITDFKNVELKISDLLKNDKHE